MSYSYSGYITSLGGLMVVATTDANFLQIVPNIIDDAEQRIYRELDLLNTVTRDSSKAFSTGTRSFSLPATLGTFYVVDTLYAYTPAGQTNGDLATRNTLQPASRQMLDAFFPSSAASGVPTYFAMTTQTSLIVGPWPDQAYQAEVVGTIHPTPLSAANTTTILTQYLPDLFLAASMVFGAAYLQNFGAAAQTDNPAMATSWETHYQALKQSAVVEEARKRFNAEGWSSKQPSQIATPPRT